MKKEMEINKIIELEKTLFSLEKRKLSDEESIYVSNAKRMPYDNLIKEIIYYQNNCLFIDELVFKEYLKKKYLVSDKEIEKRIIEVHRIYRYNNKKLNSLLKEQRKMLIEIIKNNPISNINVIIDLLIYQINYLYNSYGIKIIKSKEENKEKEKLIREYILEYLDDQNNSKTLKK